MSNARLRGRTSSPSSHHRADNLLGARRPRGWKINETPSSHCAYNTPKRGESRYRTPRSRGMGGCFVSLDEHAAYTIYSWLGPNRRRAAGIMMLVNYIGYHRRALFGCHGFRAPARSSNAPRTVSKVARTTNVYISGPLMSTNASFNVNAFVI